MANLTIKAIVRVKEILMKTIIDTGINISIIILLVVKKLKMTIELSDRSQIIMINQTKKNVIRIVRDVSFSI